MFALEGRPPLPAGRYPCCGERAYKFETISRNTGCQFREHAPDERLAADAAVMEMYLKFRDIIGMRPPQLMFPERLTRLVAREPGEDSNGRLQCKEVFWWEGIQLLPPRPALGMLGKIYTSNVKFNPSARPGSPTLQPALRTSTQSLAGNCPLATMHTSEVSTLPHPKTQSSESSSKKGAIGGGDSAGDCGDEQSSSSDDSEQSSASERSEEDAPRRRVVPRPTPQVTRTKSSKHSRRLSGRQWVSSLSLRSNQDTQRRFEERAARQMRSALARRAAPLPHPAKAKTPPGGVYARLEAEWRERHGQQRPRNAVSARPRSNKFK
ncbi:uncharacterized protein LOC113235543 isoform X1 [Hyposmocoma kahamanoa]|uniref:uncharacterized protein LOC113235543 isoform X1 n=1 Tax=Hyposmocoma kahamanoa TaxID=1477025 RepID=UPI000E6DA161|nr:uncharacterized protein LOC113235543 isoform X1 [Hyposmocoma kahamanoa]